MRGTKQVTLDVMALLYREMIVSGYMKPPKGGVGANVKDFKPLVGV